MSQSVSNYTFRCTRFKELPTGIPSEVALKTFTQTACDTTWYRYIYSGSVIVNGELFGPGLYSMEPCEESAIEFSETKQGVAYVDIYPNSSELPNSIELVNQAESIDASDGPTAIVNLDPAFVVTVNGNSVEQPFVILLNPNEGTGQLADVAKVTIPENSTILVIKTSLAAPETVSHD